MEQFTGGPGAARLSRRAFLGASAASWAAATPARVVELPGVEGRIDHLTADAAGKRLFVAALGNGTIEIVDVARGVRSNSIRDVPEPQGLLFHASSGALWAACRRDGSVRVFPGNGAPSTIPLPGGDADNIRALGRDRVIVGHGEGALAVLDERLTVEADIPLGAHPESFQIDSSWPRAYVNLPDRREITVVDLDKRKVVARWPVTVAAQNFPMALDQASGRLYVACRRPAKLLTIDTGSGRIAEQKECVGDADDVFYDPDRGRVFVIGGAGRVDTFSADGRSGFDTAAGARTGLWVAEWRTLAVAAPRREGRAARLLLFQL